MPRGVVVSLLASKHEGPGLNSSWVLSAWSLICVLNSLLGVKVDVCVYVGLRVTGQPSRVYSAFALRQLGQAQATQMTLKRGN